MCWRKQGLVSGWPSLCHIILGLYNYYLFPLYTVFIEDETIDSGPTASTSQTSSTSHDQRGVSNGRGSWSRSTARTCFSLRAMIIRGISRVVVVQTAELELS